MKIQRICLVSAALCCAAVQAPAKTVVQGNEEILFLDGLASPARWRPAECTVSASSELKARGRPTLHMHIPVDHHAGEKKYPIGWPRMYCKLQKSTETDWASFDRLEFLIYAKMSRPEPPKSPLTFQILCPDRHQAKHKQLVEMKLDQWVRISIPMSDIEHLEKLERLGFNISESNYKDKDVLDFYIGGFRLVRSTECMLISMRITNPVLFRGQPELKVEMSLAGPPKRVSRGVPFAVLHGGNALRRETLPVQRGRQTLAVDVSELKLEPAEYTLVAFEHDADRRKSETFRVVESPWKEK